MTASSNAVPANSPSSVSLKFPRGESPGKIIAETRHLENGPIRLNRADLAAHSVCNQQRIARRFKNVIRIRHAAWNLADVDKRNGIPRRAVLAHGSRDADDFVGRAVAEVERVGDGGFVRKKTVGKGTVDQHRVRGFIVGIGLAGLAREDRNAENMEVIRRNGRGVREEFFAL